VKRIDQGDAAPLSAAKERLISAVAARWGASAKELTIARIELARTSDEARGLLDELARSILTERPAFSMIPELARPGRQPRPKPRALVLNTMTFSNATAVTKTNRALQPSEAFPAGVREKKTSVAVVYWI